MKRKNFLIVFDGEESVIQGKRIFVRRNTKDEADDFMFSDDNPYKGEYFYYGGIFTDEEVNELGYDIY